MQNKAIYSFLAHHHWPQHATSLVAYSGENALPHGLYHYGAGITLDPVVDDPSLPIANWSSSARNIAVHLCFGSGAFLNNYPLEHFHRNDVDAIRSDWEAVNADWWRAMYHVSDMDARVKKVLEAVKKLLATIPDKEKQLELFPDARNK